MCHDQKCANKKWCELKFEYKKQKCFQIGKNRQIKEILRQVYISD